MNAALARKFLGKSTVARAAEPDAPALSGSDLQQLDTASRRASADIDTAHGILDHGWQRAQRFFVQVEALKDKA